MTIYRTRTALAMACLAAVPWALSGCGGADTTEEALEEAREEAAADEMVPAEGPEAVDVVERSEGTFELTLTGALEEEPAGVAVCTREAGADELRVSMQTAPPGDVRFGLAVRLDAGGEELDGDFEISGARRWGGPVEVTRSAPAGDTGGADVTDGGFELAFQGTYTGPTGGGEVRGTVQCPPLNADEGMA